ncbi:hypothetical protein IMCC26134_02180 [Verrucomicrobia bacterium IMCC26134]|nr:hypothetical protein IMCC26134_02180 [Verrucomicrobia bacterium IMCC26134]
MKHAARIFFMATLAGLPPVQVLAEDGAVLITGAESPVRLEALTVTASSRWFEITELAGRVMLRPEEAGGPVLFPKRGQEFTPGETVTTGERSRFELTGSEVARWRLGSRTVFQLHKAGARLLAGTALAMVPEKARWTVETFGSQVRLGEGTWILQAVENEGVKVICLDGPSQLETDVVLDASHPGVATQAAVRLKPGELIFIRPGARGFGPLVTIYLEELLATSRLVGSYAKPLPQLTRLRNLGIAQREQLKAVTAALVAGAKGSDGFDVYLPKAPPAAKSADEPKGE